MLARRPRAALLALACAVVLAGCGTDAPPPTPPAEGNEYVGLGDSFTAVAGMGPFTDKACKRSVDDYPSLVARELGIESFADVSCGGAQTRNLTQTQRLPGAGVNQAQLDAVSAETRLVTIGMGLNDNPDSIDVSISYALLYLCTREENGKVADQGRCNTYLRQPDSGFDSVIEDMADNLETALQQIKEQAPRARIVVVGYPRVAPDSGTCTEQLPLPPVALNRVRTVVRAANLATERVAEEQGADFVDMWAASKGHDACSRTPWVNGFREREGKAYQYHPFKSYHRAVADKIVALLEDDEPRAEGTASDPGLGQGE